jgi:hypothetical protein
LLFTFPRRGHALARDFKWLGSHRYGIVHLHGDDAAHLARRAHAASTLLGWPAPYLDQSTEPARDRPAAVAPSPPRAPEGPP